MITPETKEAEFVMELVTYCELAIKDKDTDGDRVIGYLISMLENSKMINTKRVSNFLTEGRNKLIN